jgi:microcystin-dependent protein
LPSPFIGEVRIFSGANPPSGWLTCDGQLLPVSGPYNALFQVIGNRYGGDGVSTFGLPEVRGRVPMGAGQGPGLTNRALGASGGAESHVLTLNEIPAHTHTVIATAAVGGSESPAGHTFARSLAGVPEYAASADTSLAAAAAGSAGGDQAHNNLAPYVGLSFIIAFTGVTPAP